MTMLPTMLETDRRRAGWSAGQAAWWLGVSVREYRELEAGRSFLLGAVRPTSYPA